MTAPIAIDVVNGEIVCAGPTSIINPALDGAAPLQVTAGKAAGDTVHLAPMATRIWVDDAITTERTHIARTIQHPEHGEIVYAYVDTTRLDGAPACTALAARIKARSYAAHDAAQARANATVPSCDNCGDCPQCC